MQSKFLISFCGALLVAGCGESEPGRSGAADLPSAIVRIATVEARDVATTIEVTGTVRPVERATIAAKVMGAINELRVALGQKVTRGDTLLTIAAAEISARVAQAKAQLSQAQRDLAREKKLLEQNASTPDLVKSLQDRVAMTAAMVREAEVMQGYTTITAPFAGVVARKFVDAGELAAPGVPLLEIEGDDAFEIDAGIPDALALNLRVGDGFAIDVPTAGLKFTARLSELSSAADASAHTVTARFAAPAEVRVRSGQFARVQIPGTPAPTLLVPTTAVTTLGQMERVFLALDGRAGLRLVKTGARRGDNVEILSGLAAGERVVADPPETLREGQRLEILP